MHCIGPARRGEQRDDRAVGVPHDVGAVAEQRGYVPGVDLEVGWAARGACAVAAPVREQEQAISGQRALRAKGECPPGQAAVDADDALAASP